MATLAVVGMLAGINGALIQIIMASRVAYGLSHAGQGPRWLAVVHLRRQTPMNATIVVATVVLVLALWFPIVPLAQATSTILLAVFAAVNASLLVIKYRNEPVPEGCPNYPVVLPWMGTVACTLFLLFNLVSWLLQFV